MVRRPRYHHFLYRSLGSCRRQPGCWNRSNRPLVSPGTRLVAAELKATNLPSALIAEALGLPPFPPRSATLARSVSPGAASAAGIERSREEAPGRRASIGGGPTGAASPRPSVVRAACLPQTARIRPERPASPPRASPVVPRGPALERGIVP